MAEVVRLYEQGCYKEVADMLQKYFEATSASGTQHRNHEDELIDLQSQINMLINAYYQLDEYKVNNNSVILLSLLRKRIVSFLYLFKFGIQKLSPRKAV